MTARRPRHESAKRYRVIGWLIIALLWLAAPAACELLARRFGGFVLVDGWPATVEPHEEFGGVTVDDEGGVAIWRREHPDRPPPRPTKEGFRIVVLGDSILLPALLNDRDGAARVLERELNARLDAGPYEVVNLSEGGWNTLQEEQVLLHEGLPLAPDLVLVGLSPNDNQQFAYRNGQLLEVRFLRDLERRPTQGLAGLFAARSYLYNWIWLRWKGFEYATGQTGAAEPSEVPGIVEPLQRMAARSAERGARLVVVCMPLLLGERFEPATDHCAFERVVDWAAQARIPLLDLIPAYAPHAKPDLRLDHIHLSRFGHRVLARATFDWLVALHLVPYRTVRPGGEEPPQG